MLVLLVPPALFAWNVGYRSRLDPEWLTRHQKNFGSKAGFDTSTHFLLSRYWWWSWINRTEFPLSAQSSTVLEEWQRPRNTRRIPAHLSSNNLGIEQQLWSVFRCTNISCDRVFSPSSPRSQESRSSLGISDDYEESVRIVRWSRNGFTAIFEESSRIS